MHNIKEIRKDFKSFQELIQKRNIKVDIDNIKKLDKKIISPKTENGVKPIIRNFNNNNEQFQWVADQIKEKYNQGVKLKDIAILSRTNNSLTSLELHLKKYEIQYTKSSGISILNKQHIKDLMAFISLLYNNKNSVSIKRILKDIIKSENKVKPLSDIELSSKLSEKGFKVARRTVSKYREQLDIPVARLRKEL